MTRVHVLPKGEHIAPMPALRKGTKDRLLPGGLPPVTRTATPRWVGGNKSSCEPFASQAVRIETHQTTKWLRG